MNLPSMVSLPPEHVMCRCIRPRLSVWSHPHRFGTLSSHLLCTFMSHATSLDHYRLYQHRLWLIFLFLFIAIRSTLRAINFRRNRSCHSRLELWTEGRGSRFVRGFLNIPKSASDVLKLKWFSNTAAVTRWRCYIRVEDKLTQEYKWDIYYESSLSWKYASNVTTCKIYMYIYIFLC